MSLKNSPEDKELALEEHLYEMRERLIIVIIAVMGIAFIIFPFSDELIDILRQNLLPQGTNLIVLSPMELIFMRFEISIVLAIVLSIPIIIYEIFAFMRPGLYPSERRVFITFVPISVVLIIIGAAFSYFVAIPISIGFLIARAEDVAVPMIVLKRFISFISIMLVSFGVIFQIPLLLYLMTKADLISLRDLKEKRKYVYVGLFVVSMTLAPDPTPVTPFVIMGSLVFVYEISVLFLEKIKNR